MCPGLGHAQAGRSEIHTSITSLERERERRVGAKLSSKSCGLSSE